jgi:saccharopine dehydrogenase-like NADP-dependent oxidoreductase
MKEKTLRYPGHIEKMVVLRESGFFNEERITVGDAAIRPVDFTAALLFPKWELGPGEVDITVLWVQVEGRKGGREVRHIFRLLDRHDPETGTHSMARTTGFTATAAVRMLAEGLYTRAGITPPELIGPHCQAFDLMMTCLRERGVVCEEEVAGGSPILD